MTLNRIVFTIFILTFSSIRAEDFVDGTKKIQETYNYFEGKWKCSGTMIRKNDGEQVKHDFKNEEVSYQFELKNNWMKMEYINESGSITRCQFGKNGNQYHKICFGDYEGYIHDTSTGWNKDSLNFKGESHYQSFISQSSKNYTKVDGNTYKVKSRIDNKEASYSVDWNATCLRDVKK